MPWITVHPPVVVRSKRGIHPAVGGADDRNAPIPSSGHDHIVLRRKKKTDEEHWTWHTVAASSIQPFKAAQAIQGQHFSLTSHEYCSSPTPTHRNGPDAHNAIREGAAGYNL
jgi:hypothetical protein